MSYISTFQELPASAASTPVRPRAGGAMLPPAPSLVANGLQATLGVAIMAALSLVFCTIAAGALL